MFLRVPGTLIKARLHFTRYMLATTTANEYVMQVLHVCGWLHPPECRLPPHEPQSGHSIRRRRTHAITKWSPGKIPSEGIQHGVVLEGFCRGYARAVAQLCSVSSRLECLQPGVVLQGLCQSKT